MIDPKPRERAKRDFKRARPVDAAMERIRFRPRFDLGEDFGEICLVAREHKRLREQNQVLMTIQLPYDFVVTGTCRIEVGNAPKIIESRFAAAGVIASPVDRGSSVDRQAEERKTVRAYLSSGAANIVGKWCAAQGRCHGAAVRQPVGLIRRGRHRRTPQETHVLEFLPPTEENLASAAQTPILSTAAAGSVPASLRESRSAISIQQKI